MEPMADRLVGVPQLVPQLGTDVVRLGGHADRRERATGPAGGWRQDSSSPPGSAASLAAARPSLTPRWNPASRSRASGADRFSATGCLAGIAPGTRLAFGSRCGSPAAVGAPEIGAFIASAARKPVSAGDDQRLPAIAVPSDEPSTSWPPLLNQLASTASKIGSLRVSVGGTMSPLSAELVSWFRGAASCDVPVPTDAGEPGPDSPTFTGGAAGETGRAPSADPAGTGRTPASDSSRRPSSGPRFSPAASCEPRLGPAAPEAPRLDGIAAPW